MKKKVNKNANIIKVAVIGILMAALIVGYYYHLSAKERAVAEANPKITRVDEVLARNLTNNYPPTPKEVVKYYSELTKCFYNEEYTQGQLEQLAGQARMLFDTQLAEHNEWGTYIRNLQAEIDEYKENGREISSYSVAASTDVYEFSQDGYDWARLRCIYTLRQGSHYEDVNEIFLLRKDEDGHWKIFGWELAEDDE